MIKNTFLGLVAVSTMIFSATSALAEDSITIYTGAEGRGYDTFTDTIASRIKGVDVSVENLSGSMEIAQAICDDDNFSFGPAQADAIYALRDECEFQILGKYPQKEYAMIFFPKDSEYDELSDLDENHKISADVFGSGSYLFAKTIVDIENEHGNGSNWIDAEIVEEASEFLTSAAEAGELDAAILVTSNTSAEVKSLFDEGWTLGELYDKDINDLEFNGKSLYDYDEVEFEIPGGLIFSNNQENSAYVVNTFIIARKDLVKSNRKLARNIGRALK